MAAPAKKGPVKERLDNIREANKTQSKRFKWTGFSDKTDWDRLQLLIQFIGAIAVPLSVIVGLYTFTWQQNADTARAEQQNAANVRLVDAQQQESTLQTYLNDMTTLLFDNKLGGQAPTSAEAAVIARSKTLLALSRLTDPNRKAEVVHFLYESNLIGYTELINRSIHPSIVNLDGANLSGIELRDANLDGADLSGAILSGADLSNTHLDGVLQPHFSSSAFKGSRQGHSIERGQNLR